MIMNPEVARSEHKGVDNAIERFASMMIDRMEAMKLQKWDCPWIMGRSNGRPMNLSGHMYNGGNSFFLQLYGDVKSYELPVYLTFKQAHDLGCRVLKDEKSFPVIFWDYIVRDSQGNRIPKGDYEAMDNENKSRYQTIPFMRYYNVFNVAQTDFQAVRPEQYKELQQRFALHEIRDEKGMYVNESIDNMIRRQEWICPIDIVKGNDAFYSPSVDMIQVPLKVQFNRGGTADDIFSGGMEFYSSLMHEMAHSTGHPTRLNREGGRFGDPKYAKEELVAELTSAMVGCSLGFHSRITDNSAKYLDAWIGVLKEEPKFIISLMSDVSKASELIFQRIDPALTLDRQIELPQKGHETPAQKNTSGIHHSHNFDFKALKAKVGITDVAFALGYVIDRKAGVGKFAEMFLSDGRQKTDTIIISNPSDKAKQTFFRRDGSHGDVISLIKENINTFNVPSSGNEWYRIGMVLSKLANEPVPVTEESRIVAQSSARQVFNAARYRIEPLDLGPGIPKILSERGLKEDTLKTFAPFISCVYDLENKAYSGYNIGFPYVAPGDDKILGYEMRGQGGFKSKAAGTDSHTGSWIADFSNGLTSQIENVYFFESAFDAMAFYQHNALKLDLQRSVFVSTGGQLADAQVKGIMTFYANARAIDCFDNDLPGRIYGLRTACLAAGIPASITKAPGGLSVRMTNSSFILTEKEMSVNELGKKIDLKGKAGQWKAAPNYKDWNDVIQGKSQANGLQLNKYQRTEALEQRRRGIKL